ncbi:uncharacterized protein V6R79_019221 [Siganus canaliculatus]
MRIGIWNLLLIRTETRSKFHRVRNLQMDPYVKIVQWKLEKHGKEINNNNNKPPGITLFRGSHFYFMNVDAGDAELHQKIKAQLQQHLVKTNDETRQLPFVLLSDLALISVQSLHQNQQLVTELQSTRLTERGKGFKAALNLQLFRSYSSFCGSF